MEAVREWALALCATAVLCGAASAVSVDSKLSRSMRLLLAAVFLCILLEPLGELRDCAVDVSGIVSQPDIGSDELRELVDGQMSAVAADAVEQLVRRQIMSMDIERCEVYVSTDISADGCISIGQVTVTAPGADDGACRSIAQELNRQLGIEAVVSGTEDG